MVQRHTCRQSTHTYKTIICCREGAVDITQWLRACAALAEGGSLIPAPMLRGSQPRVTPAPGDSSDCCYHGHLHLPAHTNIDIHNLKIKINLLKQSREKGWNCSYGVEHLPPMHEAMSSNATTSKTKNKQTNKKQEDRQIIGNQIKQAHPMKSCSLRHMGTVGIIP